MHIPRFARERASPAVPFMVIGFRGWILEFLDDGHRMDSDMDTPLKGCVSVRPVSLFGWVAVTYKFRPRPSGPVLIA